MLLYIIFYQTIKLLFNLNIKFHLLLLYGLKWLFSRLLVTLLPISKAHKFILWKKILWSLFYSWYIDIMAWNLTKLRTYFIHLRSTILVILKLNNTATYIILAVFFSIFTTKIFEFKTGFIRSVFRINIIIIIISTKVIIIIVGNIFILLLILCITWEIFLMGQRKLILCITNIIALIPIIL